MTRAGDAVVDRPLTSALIVEDHPLFSEALSMTLRTFVGVERIDTADRIAVALTKVGSVPAPDVIVLDLNLPDVNGMEGLIRLHQAAADTPILVVSSLTDDRVIAAALSAGASGFVPKHSQRDVFRAAFDAIRAGRRYVPPEFEGAGGTRTTAQARDAAIERLGLLTRQQAVILQLICAGKLNKQIAYDLSIAETTVKAHVTAIMRKLGVYNRTQAVLIAREVNFSTLLSDGNLSA